MVEAGVLEGVYMEKAQRFEDVCLMNQELSQAQVRKLLEDGVREGRFISFPCQGEIFYIKDL